MRQTPSHPIFVALVLPALVLPALAASGCSPTRPRLEILSTPVGPHLEALWDAHGGHDRWKSFRAMRFDYDVEFRGGARWKGRLLALLGGPPNLRAERTVEEGESPWVELPAARPELVIVEASADVGFALTALRYRVQIPFGVAGAGWRLRVLVGPEGLETAAKGELQAIPDEAGARFGPYLIPPPEPVSGPERRLTHVFYASSHPRRPRCVFEARVTRWERVAGLLVPTELAHWQRRPRPADDVPDPLELGPTGGDGSSPPLFRERLSDVRFLGEEEVDELLGREEEP